MHPKAPIPTLSTPPRRPEELHGSRLLRDAAAAESTAMSDSDTVSQGTGLDWGVLQVRKRLGRCGDGFEDVLQVWEGTQMDWGILQARSGLGTAGMDWGVLQAWEGMGMNRGIC